MDETLIIKLLSKSFSEEEWKSLEGHTGFRQLIKNHHDSHEDFEYLIEAGTLLIKRKQEFGLE